MLKSLSRPGKGLGGLLAGLGVYSGHQFPVLDPKGVSFQAWSEPTMPAPVDASLPDAALDAPAPSWLPSHTDCHLGCQPPSLITHTVLGPRA